MPAQLPTELLEYIFEELHPPTWDLPGSSTERPKSVLSACSHACRSWRSLVLPHLFRDISYSYTCDVHVGTFGWRFNATDNATGRWRVFPSLHGEIWRTIQGPCKTLAMLVDFLRESPLIASFIRSLSLRGYPAYYVGDQQCFTDATHVPLPLFLSLIANLPNIQALRTRNVFISPKYFGHLRRTPSTRLKQLSISFPAADTAGEQETVAIASCFSSIEQLQSTVGEEGEDELDYEFSTAVLDEVRSCLQTVIFRRRVWRGELITRLLETPTIHTLVFANLEPSEVWTMPLAGLCPNLREIRLRLPDDFWLTYPHGVYLDVSPYRTIEKLCISARFTADAACAGFILRSLSQTVSSAASWATPARRPLLREVVVKLDLDEWLLSKHIQELDTIISLAADLDVALVALLQRCNISAVLVDSDGQRQDMGFVERMLPRLSEQGKLRATRACVSWGIDIEGDDQYLYTAH